MWALLSMSLRAEIMLSVQLADILCPLRVVCPLLWQSGTLCEKLRLARGYHCSLKTFCFTEVAYLRTGMLSFSIIISHNWYDQYKKKTNVQCHYKLWTEHTWKDCSSFFGIFRVVSWRVLIVICLDVFSVVSADVNIIVSPGSCTIERWLSENFCTFAS